MLSCGDLIGSGDDIGRTACFLRFKAEPDRVLLLTAMHVLVGLTTPRGAPVTAADGALVGRLTAWTGLDGLTTVDAALVWVDPSLVKPTFRGAPAPGAVNDTPQIGDALTIADGRQTKITAIGQSILVTAMGPGGWHETRPYRNQIVCGRFTEAGDSGALVVDSSGRAVGMVVAGGKDAAGDEVTVVTPIDAILDPALWDGQELELLTAVPPSATSPPAPAPATPAASEWAALPRVIELPPRSRGGRIWKITADGVVLSGSEQPIRSPGPTVTCPEIVRLFGREIIEASRTHGVPPELVIMTIAVEAGSAMAEGFTGPKTFRWEPSSPKRSKPDYSVGPMQVLSATARGLDTEFGLGFGSAAFPIYASRPEPIPNDFPMYVGRTSIQCGTAMIREGLANTGTDPILVSARYNAGTLLADSANPWGLHVTGDHLDRCAGFFGDACATLKQLGR